MRWLRGLVLALCIVGSSAHPTPEGTTDIARRDLSLIASPEFDWSVDRRDENIASSDISPRDDVGNFRKWTFVALKTFVVANAGVQLYNIVHDCREFGDNARTDMNCIWASFATVLGFAVLVDRALAFRGRLADRLHANNWHVPGITSIVKRAEILQLEGELSSLLNLEVRHLGVWDGNDDDDDENSFLSKRDDTAEAAPRHVFASKFHGTDMHFAYMGEVNNSSHFRFGYGPGPDTESNRLKSRGNHKYNNQYFANGGLDFVAVTDPLNNNNPGIYLTKNDKKEFNWLVQQIRCYFSVMDRGLVSNGVNFQIFNSFDKTTLAAGAIAPFTNKRKSVIRKMAPKQGVDMIDSCAKGGLGKSPKDKPRDDRPKDELRRGTGRKKGGKKKKMGKLAKLSKLGIFKIGLPRPKKD
ncbi:hypothetical protein EMPG_13021 [Blastomyces silverae]|uniref:Uncharacterized protein n=1 Tax=Blastomyces silverae TaxID=2060906 RepID=A0A0H1BL51_9EURO|nr:hypothetical protein EMPG_13021 [Blastomyces silverae]